MADILSMPAMEPGVRAEEYVPKLLFGGALTVEMPARFADVSAFRQVPNTQEVFAHAETDQSVIIELLEMASEAPADTAALFHFHSLAHDNNAFATEVEQLPLVSELDNGGTRSSCWGLQSVAKFNEGAASANQVRVHVACFRLPHITTDIVLSYNAPVFINSLSSSAQHVDATALTFTSTEEVLATFAAIWSSLRILDYSIFSNE